MATDGSDCSYRAAREFLRIAGTAGHDVTILHVMPRLTVGRDTAYLQIELEREGLAALNAVGSIFRHAAVPAKTEMRQGVPADTILEVARDGHFDLIVIGYRGKGGMREFLLGSVSRTLVHNAPCSLLVVR